MPDWRRWVGPAGFMLAWSIFVAFVEKVPSFPTTVRGGLAIVATVIGVGWVALALCPSRPRAAAGFHYDSHAPKATKGRAAIAGRILLLALVASACWGLGLVILEFPSLVIIETHPRQYPLATQIEVRPPRTDIPVAFSLELWSTEPGKNADELPCRCQDWNPPARTTCEMHAWLPDSVTFVVRDLRHPARLGIWCDRRVEVKPDKLPQSVGVLYGSSLRAWSWSLLATGGITWIIGSLFCWRRWQV